MAAFLFVFAVASPVMAAITPTPVAAACEDRLLGIPPWYRGLTTGSDCRIQGPSNSDGIGTFITKIALNVIEIVMVLIGYIAAFFILYGGFIFIANNGSSDTVDKARKTILNAVIGLAISLGAVALVNIIFGIIS
ncbi:hypothetical protein CMN23_00755 [Candidatus Saccharibacteria bacterium]|nr:hypothetical protein [Candidatus Saccharibacteria bacterium]